MSTIQDSDKHSNEKDKTEKDEIQMNNSTLHESMTAADAKEHAKETQFENILRDDYGLDPKYWLAILKTKLGFTSSVHLKYLKGSDMLKLKPSIINDYERDAFELIIKENTKKDDAAQKKTIKDVFDEIPIDNNDFEETVRKQLGSLTASLKPEESRKAARQNCSLDDKIKNLQHASSSNAFTRTKLNVTDIISHASSGCALRGIFLNHSLDEITEMKETVISLVGDITLQGPSLKQEVEFLEFSSRKKSDDFQKSLQTTGKHAKVCANVGFSIFGVKAQGSYASMKEVDCTNITNSQEFFQSREKHAFVPVKSCDLKLENIRLEKVAMKSLQAIETTLQEGETCLEILSRCKTFFQKFGSHINTGILHFGGIFKWTATYTSLTESKSDFNKDLVYDTLEGFLNIGYAGPGPTVGIGVSGKSLSSISGISNKHTEEELSKIQLIIDSIGGPPDEIEYQKWVQTLTAENETWSLISRGNFIGIWEVLTNHQDDFCETCNLTSLLECCWNMEMVESSHEQSNSKDYELLLFTLRQTLDKLADLTGDEDYFKFVLESNVKIQTFLEQIAFSKELQNEMQTAIMQNEIFALLVRAKHAFLKDRPKLMSWISEVNKRSKDLPSALSTEQINSIHMFMSVLKSKFLPHIKIIFLVKRHRSQPQAEHYITTEMTNACNRLLADFRKQNLVEFVMLVSLLSQLQFEEKRGFLKFLTVSDIEFFISELEQTINKFDNLPVKYNVQKQANLVNYIVNTIRQNTSKSSEEIFNTCFHALKTDLENDIVLIIELHTKDSPFNWIQLQDDLQPFIDGTATHRHLHTLPDFNISLDLVEENHDENFSLSMSTVPEKVVTFLKEMTMESEVSLIDSITIHARATNKKKENLLWFLFLRIMTQHSTLYEILEQHVKGFDDKEKVTDTDDFNICDDTEDDLLLNLTDNVHSCVNINPLDLVVALFVCSSKTLKQALASKMHSCRLAVPFVLPDRFSPTASVSLLKSILLSTAGNNYTPADDCPCNILSFIRIGCPNISKSQIINDIISNENHAVFFNRLSPFGHAMRTFSEGLVEMTFFTPYVDSEKCQNMTMILNLRGNGYEYQQQIKLLSILSSGVVVFIDNESLENDSTQHLLQTVLSPTTTGVVMIDAHQRTKTYVKEFVIKYKDILKDNRNIHFGVIALGGKQKRTLEVKYDICSKMKTFFKKKQEKALVLILEESKVVVDNEGSQNGKKVIYEMRQLIDKFSNTVSLKRDVLQLQGTTLTSLSKNMKRFFKPSEYISPKHKSEISQTISHLRIKQVKMMQHIHPLMRLFIEIILYYIKFDNKELINFAHWLKYYLEKLTRKNIASGHSKYMNTLENFQAAKQKNTNRVEVLKEDVDNSESDLLSTPLGFEHFIREIGQVYEAILDQASRVSDETINFAKWLPKVPANLLLAGLPFEVMNGDIIHVPIVWVTAVLNELSVLIGDKKCLILSVVGIQSSGKSTLLNMMFGLQFPVGHGRITKGAFMQLIPVNDERLSFEIIVVIDTEGLRASELGHENYKHDNEFATFIMGIADINIVNINGESQSEMTEVLQMVVHAHLKMKTLSDSLNMKHSCIFVHQNVKTDDGTNDALAYSLQRMINLLDDMTLEAANQLEINDIESFKQVIDFDKKHVWYLPNLYTGEHPIIRVNPSYSRRIENIKETILFDIATRHTHFTITDTSSKIEDMWNGILSEDFAFNFKNNLEARAYTKLESHYQELYWRLESAMHTFVRKKKLSLFKCKSESEFDVVMKTARNEFTKISKNEFDKTKDDFDAFIDNSTLKNIMLKWKQGYRLKLQSSLQSISERSDKQILSIKDEIKQVSDCERSIKDCEDEINSYASELAGKLANESKDNTESKISIKILTDRFEQEWISWRIKCSTTQIGCAEEPEQILDLVKKRVRKNFIRHGYYLKELDNLTLGECAQITHLHGLLTFRDIKINTHIFIQKSVLTGCLNLEKSEVCINQTVDFTDKLGLKIESFLTKRQFTDDKFNEIDISYILNLVENEIENHNKHKDNDYKFRLTLQYKAMVLTNIAAYCTKVFIDINRQYDQRHNPQIKLEEYKDTAFELFVGLVHKKTEDVIAGNFFQEAIKSCILEQVQEDLPNKVEDEVLKSFEYSKYKVMKSVMKDLIDKNNFDHFSVYITSPDSYVEMWVRNYANTYLFQNDGHKFGSLSKFIVENALEDVNSAVNNATEIVKARYGSRISTWIDEFISSCKYLPISKKKLSHVGKREVNDIEHFRRTVVAQLETTRKCVLIKVTETDIETVRWKKDPYTSIFNRLWGCCATCPFCSEPCEYNEDHLVNMKHSCRQHRPQGVGDYAWERGSGELVTDTCNHLIYEGRKKFILSDSDTTHLYKHYRSKFPEWEITPNYKPSKYWMWYFKTYKKQIAEKSNTKEPKIPDEWYDITAEEAKESL